MTLYPNGIDSFWSGLLDPVTDGYVAAINSIDEAIIAIETELGLDPKGIYSDVATRLSILEGRIGPGATITGGPIDINNANLAGVLAVDKGGTGLNLASSAANPDEVLVSTGAGIAYSLIANVNVDTAAAIAVSKLAAAGTDGYTLTTVVGVPTWSSSSSFAVGGDVSGTIGNQTVNKIKGKNLSTSLSTVGVIQDGYSLTWVNASTEWQAKPAPSGSFTAGGDLSGSSSSQTVIAIQNVPVNATAPADGYVLTYDLADGYWHPAPTAAAITLPLTAPDGGTGFNAAYLTANPDEALVINGAGTDITSIPIINLPLPLADLDPTGADGYDIITLTGGVWAHSSMLTRRLTPLDGYHIHAWECTEAAGVSTLADTGNTAAPMTLTISGAPGAFSSGVPGLLGNCVTNTGTEVGYADSPLTAGGGNPGSDFPTGTNPYTLEWWFSSYALTASTRCHINATRNTGANEIFQFYTNATPTWEFAANNGPTAITAIDAPRPQFSSQWTYVAITFDGATYKLFINGITVKTFAGSWTAPDWTTAGSATRRFGIFGNADSASGKLSGALSRVRMSNIARSQTYFYDVYRRAMLY
jgi:hypothetical protein